MRKKILMTLALILTAVTGAWAQADVTWTYADIYSDLSTKLEAGQAFVKDGIKVEMKIYPNLSPLVEITADNFNVYGGAGYFEFTAPEGKKFSKILLNGGDCYCQWNVAAQISGAPATWEGTEPAAVVTTDPEQTGFDFMLGSPTSFEFYFASDPIEVTPVAEPAANTKQWTFSMPASDVVLTPVYSAATVYTFDGQAISETPYETLKEAFAKVKDGDVITLDWDVTLTEMLGTPETDGGVKFTLDFNGYTIDGGNFGLSLMNQGDQLTFTDSSEDQMGGLKCKVLSFIENSEFVFDAGRYNILTANAETLNGYCSTPGNGMELADGKEFIDLEGGAEANDGFTTRVDFKTFELAIGPKEFDTFYADKNIVIDAETAEGINLYTITAIDDDRSEATLSSISGTIAAGTPMLVYNSTEVQKLVKIKFTAADASTAATAVPEFKGTAVAREFTADDMTLADYYALSGGKAFAYVKNAGTIAANQCWLQFDKPQPGAKQRAINIVFEEGTTELDEIENDEPTDDTWYDLTGRKLDGVPATKGVFIKNGKKVMK